MTTSPATEPATVVEGLQLLWYIELRLADARWWTDPEAMATVVAAVAATARWKELEVIGAAYRPGTPLGPPADVVRQLASGGPGLYNLARGGPRHATYGDETEAWLQIGIAEHVLKLISHVRGDVLDRLGPAAIDDMVTAIARIRSELGDRVRVLEMHARPTALGELSYPHLISAPPPDTATPLSAVVDVVEQEPARELPEGALARTARLIAAAEVPTGATRQSIGELVVVRWVDDPRSPIEICQAAARHEAWLVGILGP